MLLTGSRQNFQHPRNYRQLAIANDQSNLRFKDDVTLFPRIKEVGSGHHHNDEILFVDLDEAAHAGYVIYKYGHSIISQHSFDLLKTDINEEVAQLFLTPNEWLRSQVIQTSSVNTCMDFGLSGIILPLSVLAMRAGIEETHEAWHNYQELNEKRCKIAENLQLLQEQEVLETETTSPEAVFIHYYAKKIEIQSLAQIDSALKHNFYNGVIGCNSMLSGGAIFTKVAQDTTLKAVTIVVSKSAALTTATTVIGIAGTIVLGPVAALAAVGLGGFFVHQARLVGKELAQDRQLIETSAFKNINKDDAGYNVEKQAYQAFIDRKFTSRENFATRFKRWNCGFLTGACLYAISAVAKAVIGVTVLTGVATLLATPAFLGVVMVMGIVGGIFMGVCSWQFLMSHGKGKKHQAYRIQESPFLGRRFDAMQTVYAMTQPVRGDVAAASSLRVALYNFMFRRDSTRQQFLQKLAITTNKYRAWKQRATDVPETVDLVSKKKQRYKNVLARLSYAYSYLSNRWSGVSHHASIYIAKKLHAQKADELTVFGLERWLDGRWFGGKESYQETCACEQDQYELLTTMLREQQRFLVEKSAAYETFSPTFRSNNFPSEELALEVQHTFKVAQEEAELDMLRLQRINAILRTKFPVSLYHLKREFLRLQGVDMSTLSDEISSAELNARLAQYLLTDLSNEMTTTRGILFDMHRRAVHLHRAL